MNRKSVLQACAIIAGIGLPAFGHEGHGHTSSATPVHYVIEPIHVAQLAAVALAIGVLAWWSHRRTNAETHRRG